MKTTKLCVPLRLCALCIFITAAPALDAAKQTNFLFFLVDDMGWADIGANGSTFHETPNIDRLAKSGMRFTQGYAAGSVCSPTRASIMTGRHPVRVDITDWIPGQANRPANPLLHPEDRSHLPLEEVTIAEALKEHGYQTFFAGKWHLGDKGQWPTDQGFDINIGGTSYGGPPSFFSPYRNATLPDGEPGEYLPDRLVDETIGFIRDHKAKPWMVHLWFYTVHWPMQAPKALLKKYADRTGPGLNDTRYGAMIEAMDLAVGRLLASLEALGLDDETLVVFTSDNGGFAGVSDCRPLRESMGHQNEGGIRVPSYTASKSGVGGLTKLMANEWAPRGINVNAIAPGYIATNNTAALQADETRNRQILERIPEQRWGDPADIGGAAVFLASRAADYVQGHILAVDGGWLAR